MYKFYNANPRGRFVNDCTVRAFSLATDVCWDCAYRALSLFAQEECIMPDDVEYIDSFLIRSYKRVYDRDIHRPITVGEFVRDHPHGTYLITMNGHITCCKEGCVYDTFNPLNRKVWDAYKIK